MFQEERYHMPLSNKAITDVFQIPLFLETAISKNSFERLHVRNLYLLSEANNYCCGRAVQGELSKFT